MKDEKQSMKTEPVVIEIKGPTGSGKSTLLGEILKRVPKGASVAWSDHYVEEFDKKFEKQKSRIIDMAVEDGIEVLLLSICTTGTRGLSIVMPSMNPQKLRSIAAILFGSNSTTTQNSEDQ